MLEPTVRRLAPIMALMLAATTLSAKSVVVDTIIGYNGLVKLGTWNPVIVELENTGASGRFTLSVEVRKGTSYRASRTLTFSEGVELPAGSRKRLDFAVPIESAALPIRIVLRNEDEVLSEREHGILGKVVRAPLVVALSRSSAFDFLIPDSVVAYPHPELLPARWDAYLAVDVLVFHDAELSGLSNAQTEAIARWIDFGGTLLVVGGSRPRSDRALSSLLPVDFAGLTRIAPAEAYRALGIEPPAEARNEASVPATRFAGEDAFVVRHARGNGRVVVVAFDIGNDRFGDPADRKRIWRNLTAERTSVDIDTRVGRVFENPMMSALLSTAETEPTRLFYLGAAAAYLAIVFALLTFLKRAPRSVLRWVVFAFGIGAPAIAAHYGFNRALYPRAYMVATTSVAEYRSGAEYARVTTDLAIVSTTKSRYRIEVGSDPMIVLPRTRRRLLIDSSRGVSAVVSEHPRPWTHDAFRIEEMTPMRFETYTEHDGTSFRVRVENRTKYLFLGGVFMYRGVAYRTGPLAPDGAVERSFRVSTAPVGTSLSELYEEREPLDAVVQAGLMRLLVEDRQRALQEEGMVFFVGWFAEPPTEIRPEEHFRFSTDSSMVVVVIDPEATGRV